MRRGRQQTISRRRLLLHLVMRGLSYRPGRSLLLAAVLAMAASLVTALGIVTASMDTRIAEEVRRYGANLVIVPVAARLDVGSGGLNFGVISEPAYLEQGAVLAAVQRQQGRVRGCSLHLQATVAVSGRSVPAEGVAFAAIRQLFPWWQLQGSWPTAGGVLAGSDLARMLALRVGDRLALSGERQDRVVQVTGIVTTGGDEDKELLLDLGLLQELEGVPGKVSRARLLVVGGGELLAKVATTLQGELPGAQAQAVRQLASSSDALLRKVQLLLLLVTGVVLVAAGASVAGTMSATVLERGREIGLLKAIGSPRRGVVLIFGLEACVLGAAGGVAGYLAGNLLALLITRSVFSAPIDFLPLFAPAALLSSLGLAGIGSLGPLLAVYRLDPAASLRGE